MEEEGLVMPFRDGDISFERTYGSLQDLAYNHDMDGTGDDELGPTSSDPVMGDAPVEAKCGKNAAYSSTSKSSEQEDGTMATNEGAKDI
jgi:hypothetical protein